MRRSLPSLSVLLLWPSLAAATDLAAHVEAWTLTRAGQAGSDGRDSANGVAITSSRGILAVGQVDGAAGHGHDALAVEWSTDSVVRWEEAVDAGEIGPDRAVSEDGWNAVAVDPTSDDVVLCGLLGPSVVTDPPARYRVEGRDAGTPPVPDWGLAYFDGASSPRQECRGVALDAGNAWTAGWADRGADEGRWLGLELDNVGAITPPILGYQFLSFPAVADRAHGVGVHSLSGDVTLVGERGVSGTPSSLLNDADWHVRQYSGGVLQWQATLQGQEGLIDRANGVVVDPATGDVVVVGWVNGGTDNAGGADLDWRIVRYARLGDGAGGPDVLWEATYESAPGASEGATAVALDDDGDLLVAGWAVDPGTGLEVWRVGKYILADGFESQEWLGSPAAGDSRALAIATRDDLIAVAGTVAVSAGDPDFAVTLLDLDDDGDGVADSVDVCPTDPDKSADGGACGCNVPDIDTDGDSALNCLEDCPDDPAKTEPGVCGCNEPDADSDGDLTLDCEDRCPTDPNKTENDIASGGCGCGSPNTDSDGDGVLGCNDACANTPPGTEVDEFGCPPSDDPPEDTGAVDDTDGDEEDGGCGCATSSPTGAVVLGLPLLLLAARRRRS